MSDSPDPSTEALEALDTIARDSLESPLADVLQRDDDGEITVAVQQVYEGITALAARLSQAEEALRISYPMALVDRLIFDLRCDAEVGHLHRSSLEKWIAEFKAALAASSAGETE